MHKTESFLMNDSGVVCKFRDSANDHVGQQV
jgi:hypothetical protein